MAARVCSECGGLVASSLSVCPHCGYFIGRSDGGCDEPQANYNSYGHQGAQPRCTMPNPHNNILWPIVALVFFWPCAIGSLIYFVKSDQAWNAGNAELARSYGQMSNKWGIASILVIAILFVLAVVLFVSVLSLGL